MYIARFPVKVDINKKARLKYKDYKDRGESVLFFLTLSQTSPGFYVSAVQAF